MIETTYFLGISSNVWSSFFFFMAILLILLPILFRDRT